MHRNAREIESITFGILSPEEIKAMAVCKVDTTKLTGPGSVYDPRMGTLTDSRKDCVTCGMTTKMCPGHFGYIELVENIIHPLFPKMVVAFLKCFCNHCYRIIIHPDQVKLWGLTRFKGENRFVKILERLEKVDICHHCNYPQPQVAHKAKEGTIQLEYKKKANAETGEKAGKISLVLEVEEIKTIFDNVQDDDLVLLGFDPLRIRPRNLIMSVFPVLPPCARPYIMTNGNICDDDLTNQIVEIIKDNQKLAKNAEEKADPKIRQKLLSSLKFHISTFYNNSKGKAKHPTNSQPIKGLKERLSSKEGQIRQNNMGKRVDFSARTVIGPDPTLKMGQMAIPHEIASVLTFPERVTAFNIEELTELVNNGKANFVIRNNGDTCINLQYALFRRGTELLYGDIIIRDPELTLREDDDGKLIVPESEIDRFDTRVIHVITGNEVLRKGDRVIRNGELMDEVRFPTKKRFTLMVGDIVERQLRDGDYVLLNRQPTLHKGSMIAKEVVVRPFKTFRMNLATTKTFNADFDGDEMNIHAPQSYETVVELKMLSATQSMMVSPQESKPNIAIVQDSLLGAYRMTKGLVKMTRDKFYNISLSGSRVDGSTLWSPARIQTIRRVMQKFGKKVQSYTGHGLISLILPYDFYYEKNNKANPDEPTVRIFQGVMYEGTLNKAILGASHNSLIQVLYKEYGAEITANFVDNIQFITNAWLMDSGFSVGLEDCMVASQESQNTIQDVLVEAYTKAQGIEDTTHNPGIREVRVTAALSQAKDVGMRIAKDAMNSDNNFLDTVGSGSKGDFFNIAQLTAMLGQQNLSGQRVKPTMNHGRRTLPHYPMDGKMSREREYESRGFVSHSFIHGLTPQEFFFHAMSGREGICDTAMSTADSGYIQRRIVKVMEDMQIQYDGTVRDTTGMVCQFAYSETGWDASQTIKVGDEQEVCDVSRIIQQLNFQREMGAATPKSTPKVVKAKVAKAKVVKPVKKVAKKIKKKIVPTPQDDSDSDDEVDIQERRRLIRKIKKKLPKSVVDEEWSIDELRQRLESMNLNVHA